MKMPTSMTPEIAAMTRQVLNEMSTIDLLMMQKYKPSKKIPMPDFLFKFVTYNIPNILTTRTDVSQATGIILEQEFNQAMRKVLKLFG